MSEEQNKVDELVISYRRAIAVYNYLYFTGVISDKAGIEDSQNLIVNIAEKLRNYDMAIDEIDEGSIKDLYLLELTYKGKEWAYSNLEKYFMNEGK